MHLVSNYICPTAHGGHCRVRIFEPEDRERDSPVVILTELANNPGQSVTNAAKEIATKVMLENALPTNRTVFVEHYEHGARGTREDPATFDLLTFSNHEPEAEVVEGVWRVDLGEPSWKALDRATVQALIGGRVD